MFNLPQNNQQLIPMGMQQQPIANMTIQSAQTYYPSVKNLSYGNDTFVNVGAPQKDIAKGFWDGFKTVFSKIGEFCSDNFALILTGVGLFGGCKFCSSSMKTYEENKKNGKLDGKGNLKDKDASVKDKAMNSVGYCVHKVFGSSNSEEVKEVVKTDAKESLHLQDITQFNTDNENALKSLLERDIMKGNVSNILKIDDVKNKNIIKICALEVIQENFDKIASWRKHQRPETIVKTLEELSDAGIDSNIRQRAINVATELKDNDYFNATQKKTLNRISKIKLNPSPQETEEAKAEKEEEEKTTDSSETSAQE